MNFALTLLATIPLYILACYLLLPEDPRKELFDPKCGWRFILGRIVEERAAVAILFLVLAVHLLEVASDHIFTGSADSLFGAETFTAWFKEFELPYWSAAIGANGGATALSPLSYYLAVVYLIVHPIMLGFVPAFLLFSCSRRLKEMAVSYVIMYAISLPFYLFFPVKNVFTAYGASTPLLAIFGDVRNGWYRVTTENNCFPSLHVAMVVIIAFFAYAYWKDEGRTEIREWRIENREPRIGARESRIGTNPEIRTPKPESRSRESRIPTRGMAFFAISAVYAASVIFGVVFLTIHWITDVVGGLIVAAISIYFGIRYSKRDEKRQERRAEQQFHGAFHGNREESS